MTKKNLWLGALAAVRLNGLSVEQKMTISYGPACLYREQLL